MQIDDLDSLMAQFMSLQQTKSNPLSERTLIQILLKLPNFNLIFYQTTDGNQYITQQYLDSLIALTIKQRGRVLTSQLPQMLGVNLDVIESRLNIVCNKHSLTKVEDKLMSPRYLNQVISNLREQIEIKGKMTIESMIQLLELPSVFVKRLVEDRIGELNSELVKDVFVTKEYREKLKAQVVGLLNGVLKPSNLSMLLKKYSIEDESIKEIIEELIVKNKVNGKIVYDYYVPTRFQQNQKILIEGWLQNNSYIQYTQLQKNFFISKPKEWIKTNLKNKVIFLDDSIYNISSIEHSKTNLLSLLKQEGFVELNKIFPSFTENDIGVLFNEHLKLNNLLISNGYCFDPEWLNKCANVFKEKIIYNLFFKAGEDKGKKKEKGGKGKGKEKITVEEMKELLLENDLVEYNTLEQIQEILHEQLSPRIQQLYKECSTELTQAKGIITANILRYKKGKTIIPSKQRCIKYLNTIEKQYKKSNNGKQWRDPEFGVTAEDPEGILSILYFDKIPAKDWGVVKNVTWESVEKGDKEEKVDRVIGSKYMEKCKVGEVIRLLVEYNQEHLSSNAIGYPFLVPDLNQYQQYGAYAFRFHIQSEQKYVIVDELIPLIDNNRLSLTSSSSWPALAEKAYAKLRYCYKGILNLGLSTIIQQLTGLTQLSKAPSSNFKEGSQEFHEYSKRPGTLSLGVTEGELNSDVDFEGEPSGFKANRCYLIVDSRLVTIGEKEKWIYKVRINNDKYHERFVVPEEQREKEKWLDVAKEYCVLDVEQMGSVFKTIYVFGKQ